jgi:hypothetical protein
MSVLPAATHAIWEVARVQKPYWDILDVPACEPRIREGLFCRHVVCSLEYRRRVRGDHSWHTRSAPFTQCLRYKLTPSKRSSWPIGKTTSLGTTTWRSCLSTRTGSPTCSRPRLGARTYITPASCCRPTAGRSADIFDKEKDTMVVLVHELYVAPLESDASSDSTAVVNCEASLFQPSH